MSGENPCRRHQYTRTSFRFCASFRRIRSGLVFSKSDVISISTLESALSTGWLACGGERAPCCSPAEAPGTDSESLDSDSAAAASLARSLAFRASSGNSSSSTMESSLSPSPSLISTTPCWPFLLRGWLGVCVGKSASTSITFRVEGLAEGAALCLTGEPLLPFLDGDGEVGTGRSRGGCDLSGFCVLYEVGLDGDGSLLSVSPSSEWDIRLLVGSRGVDGRGSSASGLGLVACFLAAFSRSKAMTSAYI